MFNVASEPIDFKKRSHDIKGTVIKSKDGYKIKGLKLVYDDFSKEQLLDILGQTSLPHSKKMDKEELIRIMENNDHRGGEIDGILKISSAMV